MEIPIPNEFKDIDLQLREKSEEEKLKNNLPDLSATLKIVVYGKV